ncbi:MAG: response regulator transcription factor [Dehalococcoidia bacterium]
MLENDSAIQRLISLVVRQEGLIPIACPEPAELMRTIDSQQTGVVVFDVGFPADDGLVLIANVKQTFGVPVLVITAGGEEVASRAVTSGADDFLPKPFDPDGLVDRLLFLLGRPLLAQEDGADFEVGAGRLNTRARTLTVSGKQVLLSKTEWDILSTLALGLGEPVLQSDLGRNAFTGALTRDPDYLKVWIDRIQTKLGCDPANPRLLKPVHGIAYTLAGTRLPD